ncbi:MAG TPA: TIM barrel protein [Gemmatimonadaceae bacterium]|nr:TIM barrel protein [Gemmatimonadaceae bacterium]
MELSLCLEMLFTDRPFIERLAIASRLGYRAIEFWDWRDKDLPALADAAARLGLTVAAISGNRQHALIDPDARPELIEEMDQVFAAAGQLNCRRIMMLSDVLSDDGSAAPTPPRPAEEKIETMVENLQALADRAEAASVTLLLEPLNTALDHRGCFLNTSALGIEIVRRVNSPQVKLLYDIYHMSMMGEDVLTEIKNLEWVGYFHVADVPGRHQPGTGKIDYQAVNTLLRRVKYGGFIGMEFSALGPDEQAAKAPLEIFG